MYDESEAHSLALIVLRDIAGVELAKDLMENYAITDVVDSAVERLRRHEPIQYIIGWTDFCGLRIKCDQRALIPRPETEWVLSAGHWPLAVGRILDLGTGTGCIALALARRFPEAEVIGVDISDDALALARENAVLNGIDNVRFMKGDILQLDIEGKFDIIISNPPYITPGEAAEMRRNVMDYEPHGALFVPEGDALVFHRAIASFAQEHLADNGMIVMEINEHLAAETAALIPSSRIINDQFDHPRFITN